jgi:signal transduction histidine kinase
MQAMWDQMRADLRSDGLPQLNQACQALCGGSLGPFNVQQQEDLASLERSVIRLTHLLEDKTVNWSNYGEAAHTLRGPLNSATGFSRLMLKDIDGQLNEAQRAALDTIHSTSRRFLALFNLLLEALLLTGDGLCFDVEPMQVEKLLNEFINTGSTLADNCGTDFEAEVAPQLIGVSIISDEKRLAQALVALLAVTVKYMDDGIVTVRAALHKGQLLLHLENQRCLLPAPLVADLQSLLTDATNLCLPYDARLRLGLAWHLVNGLGGTLEAYQVGGTSAFTVTIPIN